MKRSPNVLSDQFVVLCIRYVGELICPRGRSEERLRCCLNNALLQYCIRLLSGHIIIGRYNLRY
jgi:hypothetical protein